MDNSISSRLRLFRKQTGLTQREFAKELGVNPSYYSDLENGRRTITGKFIEKLSEKYGVSRDWFYTGKGEENLLNRNQNIHPKNTPSIHPDQENEAIQRFSAGWEGVVKNFMKNDYKVRVSDEYKRAETIKTQILIKNAEIIKTFVDTLKIYWTLQIKFMTFINQFDKYLLPDITYEFYEEIKKGRHEDDIIEDFNSLIPAIEELPKIIQILCNNLTKIFDQSKQFDFGNQLDRDLIAEIKQLVINQDFEYVSPLKRIIDLYEKKYTP